MFQSKDADLLSGESLPIFFLWRSILHQPAAAKSKFDPELEREHGITKDSNQGYLSFFPMPASFAITIAWARSGTWSLLNIFDMWLLTVFMEICSRLAIS